MALSGGSSGGVSGTKAKVPGPAKPLASDLLNLSEASLPTSEDIKFRPISEQFGRQVLPLSDPEESLRQGIVQNLATGNSGFDTSAFEGGFGETLASLGSTVGRGVLNRNLGNELGALAGDTIGLRPDITPAANAAEPAGAVATRTPSFAEQLAFNILGKTASGAGLSPDSNPALQAQIEALLGEGVNALQTGVNSIRNQAFGAGAGGGSREALSIGEAVGDFSRGFTTNVANLLGQNFQNERDRQLAAISPLLNVEQSPTSRLISAKGFEAEPRELEQAELNAQINDFLRQQAERFLPLEQARATLGQRMGQSTTTQQSSLGGGFRIK